MIVILLLSVLITIWRFKPDKLFQPILKEGVVGIYTSSNLPLMITSLISEPLIITDKSAKPQPHLASEWKVNDKATIYTFTLKDNLYWQDGTKLISSDIKFNLTDVEVTYPDNKTIEFKLADSFSPFPNLLTSPVFKNNTLIGVGNFKVESILQNRNFVRKISLKPIYDNLPKIEINFYPDEKTAKTAFELGEVEAILTLYESNDIKENPSVKVKNIINFNKLVAIFYNTKDAALSDKNYRKALNFATPLVVGEERAKSPLPVSSWAFNEGVKELLGNEENAKSYLKKVPQEKRSTITLTATPSFSQIGELIIESWKKAGIPAVLRIESGMPQNFQALLTSQTIPTDPDQYSLWHSTQTNTNISKYSSPRIDKDLEDGRKSGDLNLRKEKYLDFQKVILDEAPATFLYFRKQSIVYRAKAEDKLNKILPLQISQ